MTQRSYLEQTLYHWIQRELPQRLWPKREYLFHPERRWRLDFAWPEHRFAVEVDGLHRHGAGTAHQRRDGILRDAEKAEALLRLGWRLYRVPGPWVATPKRWILRPEVIDTIREQLATTPAAPAGP